MKRLAIFSLAALLTGAVLWACGPFWPNLILGSDEMMLEAFHGIFTAELARLGNGARPPFEALPDDDPADQTAKTDLAETEEILKGLGTPPDRTKEIVDDLWALRVDLGRLGATEDGEEIPTPDPSTLEVPAGLPPELALYLKGALAWHLDRQDEAKDAWTRLLDLPEDKRRHRSTWAAFMLGKTSLDDDPEEAVRRFRLTRDLAAQGFADSLGLAASSLGWEALAEMNQDHLDKALLLYQRQRETGDPTAFGSLLLASAKTLSLGPEPLARVAQDPEARAILTAYVVSRAPDEAGTWLKALEAAGVRDQANADRLAWAAYLAGDFEQAAAWLDRAQESSPIARWVRARLLLRDGRLDEARELLAGVARDLPQTGLTLEEAFWFSSESGEVLAAPQRAAGEEAAIRLTQKNFTGALDELLRAGYWRDSAYLAEMVLTADELKTYVDATWPADLAAAYQPPGEDEWEPMLAGGYTAPPPGRLAHDLRYLLGRRLAREGRLKEASPYLPSEPRAALESFAAHIAAGRNARRPRSARADELFEAACVLRQDGMEVTGAEIAPDWTLFGGSYDLGDSYGEERDENRLFVRSPEEMARVKKSRFKPWRRFHYRYRAADLAWDAAKLLPRGDRKAEILATAGNWIKNRDPRTADRFYKELVHCCGSTDLGREADDLHWFPQADACPASGDSE